MCLIWRSGCQGVALIGHLVGGEIAALNTWGGMLSSGCRGDAAASVFATVVSLICGDFPKTFVRRTVRSLRSSAARLGGLLTGTLADLVVREYGGAAPSRQPETGCECWSGRGGNLVLRRERVLSLIHI